MDLKYLEGQYKIRKADIEKRLCEFESIGKGNDNQIYKELVFCLMTPQSSARSADKALKKLEEKNLILSDESKKIQPWLAGVRFRNVKSENIALARKLFNEVQISEKVKENPEDVREWLVENVRGMGYKEAGHFLRNIGFGKNIAILDRHILKNLLKYEIIDEIPKSLTPKKYFEIEDKMKVFSDKIKIPLDHLDLLFWSEETGEIFK